MNPSSTFDALRRTHRTYVDTFQRIQNPVIRDWVRRRLDRGSLLWRGPFCAISAAYSFTRTASCARNWTTFWTRSRL